MVPREDSIRELEAAASKLNQRTDQLNAVIEKLEERLRASGIGIPLWLDNHPLEPTSKHGEEDSEGFWYEAWFLGFAKLGGNWCLAAKKATVCELEDEDGDSVLNLYDENAFAPLTRAPRSVRVEAASLLPHLINKLTTRAKKYIADIDRAAQLVAVTPPRFFLARADTYILRFSDETTAQKAQQTLDAAPNVPPESAAKDIGRRFRAEDIIQMPQALTEGKQWSVCWTAQRPAGGAIPTAFAPDELMTADEEEALAWAQQLGDMFLTGEADPWDEKSAAEILARR